MAFLKIENNSSKDLLIDIAFNEINPRGGIPPFSVYNGLSVENFSLPAKTQKRFSEIFNVPDNRFFGVE